MGTEVSGVILFTGDGKGKTTAALGMSMRAAGHGMRVCFIQFIKSGALPTGEAAFLEGCDSIDLIRSGLGWAPSGDDPAFDRHAAAAREGLDRASQAVLSRDYAMIVLDEICVAIEKGLIETSAVCDFLCRAAGSLIIVMTGRNAPDELVAAADTVTEMRCIKHAFGCGKPPRNGIEI